jgi:Ca2+-transporting ATPase
MTVKELHTEEKEMVAIISSLCNKASITREGKIIGDPTEGALLMLTRELKYNENELRKSWRLVHEFPFDSNRKRMSVIVEKNGEKYILVKGAPDSMISICNLADDERKKIESQNEEGAHEAMRMMAFACKKIENAEGMTKEQAEQNLTFIGLCGMMDPPREEVPEAVKIAKQAGIMIYIVTGDHGLTAQAIGKKIGLETETVMTGTELEKTPDRKLLDIFAKKQPLIFARVSPQDKLRIVSLLKENNEVVAVTGDGVNDAPALKRADIGIAMGITGTDVAKEASSMVLSDDSFGSIVAAIQEGRTIYENLKKFILYIFSSNMGELVVIFTAMLLGLKMPLTAIMILIINIGTDVLPALALGVEKGKTAYMKKPPRDPKKKILNHYFVVRMCFLGMVIGLSAIAAYLWGLRFGNEKTAMTMTYVTLILSQMLNVCNARDSRESVLKQSFNNSFLIGAIAISIAITVATVHLPLAQAYIGTVSLAAKEWLIAIGISAFTFIAEETRKYFFRRKPA